MHGPDGTDYENHVVYREVAPPERIVYDHVSDPVFQSIVTFDELDGRTKLTLRMVFEAAKDRADEVSPGLADETAAELAFLQANWPKSLPEGVAHADLFPDNVFFVGDKLSGLIDFYFACDDFLAYDLAICLNAWCFELDGSFNYSKGAAMIAGYSRVRALEPAEIQALPILARGSALRFMLTRLVDWLNVPPGALVKPKDPRDYLSRLRFHQRVKSAADYGLDA